MPLMNSVYSGWKDRGAAIEAAIRAGKFKNADSAAGSLLRDMTRKITGGPDSGRLLAMPLKALSPGNKVAQQQHQQRQRRREEQEEQQREQYHHQVAAALRQHTETMTPRPSLDLWTRPASQTQDARPGLAALKVPSGNGRGSMASGLGLAHSSSANGRSANGLAHAGSANGRVSNPGQPPAAHVRNVTQLSSDAVWVSSNTSVASGEELVFWE